MTITQAITAKIQESFAPTHFELENESHNHGGGAPGETHFRLVVVSPAFDGLSRIDRQRKVMDLFTEERARGLHALTLRVMTPDEWDKVRDSFEMVSPACRGGSKREVR